MSDFESLDDMAFFRYPMERLRFSKNGKMPKTFLVSATHPRVFHCSDPVCSSALCPSCQRDKSLFFDLQYSLQWT